MASQSELIVRKKRQPASQLSPENFHISLFNAVVGGSPVISDDGGKTRLPNQAYVEDEEEPTDTQAELDAAVPQEDFTTSSEDNDTSSADPEPEPPCKKHTHQHICEKHKCPKHKNLKCLKDKNHSSESSEQEPSTSADSNISSNTSSKRKQKQKELKSTKTSSSEDKQPSSSSQNNDDSSAQESGEASTSASTLAAESSKSDKHHKSRKSRSSASKKQDDTSSGEDDGSGWTLSEDHQLRGMKEDSRNPTWAEIAQVLGRSKSEVKQRWKTIKDQPHQRDIDLDDTEDEEDSPQDKQSKNKKSASKKAATPKTKSKKEPRPQTADNPDPIILSGEEPSSDTDSDPASLTYGPNRERRRQARYLHRHIYNDLYPPNITPKPDEYFGSKDCEVLAAVESKWQRSKWLEMQANFYNVTGRMVPLNVIREKCERADVESGRGMMVGKDKKGHGKVERWVSKVEQDDLDDPES